MFGRKTITELINHSAENEADRRKFLRTTGIMGVGAAGATVAGGLGMNSAIGDEISKVSDGSVLNFALNLEYLEAEFYQRAAFGRGLPDRLIGGKGKQGGVVGGRKVTFQTAAVRRYAEEIATDELDHVAFLRAALGKAKVARPRIDLRSSFTAAARAAGLIGEGQQFDPFANEDNFLLGAFLFEDVGVTAYKGAAPLITNKTFLEAAAGILAVEAYHAGIVRTAIASKGLSSAATAIAGARDSLDGGRKREQSLKAGVNLVPTDKNGIAFSRPPARVLNVVYLNPAKVRKGGFYPNGVNGAVNTSGAAPS